MSRSLVFFLVFAAGSIGQTQRLQPFIESISFADTIVVRGFKGNLQIVPIDSDTLRVEAEKTGKGNFDQWTYTVRKKPNGVEVVVKGPSDQEDWEKIRSKDQVPSFDMKIMAPAKAMQIFWGEGKVTAQRWGGDLSVQMTEGEVVSTGGKGNLKVQMINGTLRVSEHEGPIDLQTYKGQSFISKSKGALNLSNHSARYLVSDFDGPIDFTNHSGTVSFKKVSGRSQVKNISGTMQVRDFDGSFTGEFSKGSLDISMSKLHDFVVNSDEANITLDAPKESGAVVDLRSEKGDLWAPIHLRKIKKGRWEERKGRLKGDEQGNIKIVSKYGNIVLK